MKVGDVVISTAGHDMGEWYVVENIYLNFVFLVDGKYKLFSCPKQKNAKHVLKTPFCAEEIASRLKRRQKVLDADVQKTLKFFKNKIKETVCQKKT